VIRVFDGLDLELGSLNRWQGPLRGVPPPGQDRQEPSTLPPSEP